MNTKILLVSLCLLTVATCSAEPSFKGGAITIDPTNENHALVLYAQELLELVVPKEEWPNSYRKVAAAIEAHKPIDRGMFYVGFDDICKFFIKKMAEDPEFAKEFCQEVLQAIKEVLNEQ